MSKSATHSGYTCIQIVIMKKNIDKGDVIYRMHTCCRWLNYLFSIDYHSISGAQRRLLRTFVESNEVRAGVRGWVRVRVRVME